jgi:hypothetical protein
MIPSLSFRRIAVALILAAALAIPASANVLVEMSFREKMTASDSVIVGTVTSTLRSHPGEYDSSATVSVLATLKGEPRSKLVVLTSERIPEESPQCCAVGATYVMFLMKTPDGTKLRSVNGRFGMIRIGPDKSDPAIEVLKTR